MPRRIAFALVFVACTAMATPEPSKCDVALQACLGVIDAQDTQIKHLTQAAKDLSDQTLPAASASNPLPTWLYIGLGLVGGLVIGKKL